MYLYDIATATTTQITNESECSYESECYYYNVQINNNGKVVWERGGYEIFLYDIATDTTTQISPNFFSSMWPEINNNGQVIFVGNDFSTTGIFLYDITSDATTFIADFNGNHYYSVPMRINDNSQAVWAEIFSTEEDGIFLATISESPTTSPCFIGTTSF